MPYGPNNLPKLFQNEAALQLAADMYKTQKMLVSKIAEEFGVSVGVIYCALRYSGVIAPKKINKIDIFKDPSNLQRAIDMYTKQKMSLRQIAKEFLVSYATIYQALKQAKVKMRVNKCLTKIPKATQKEICKYYVRNGSCIATGKKFKLSHVHICDILRWHSLVPFWSITGKEVFMKNLKGMQTKEIAQYLGLRMADVYKWKHRLGLKGN